MARRNPEPLDRTALLNYALRALAMRAMSATEMRAKLLRRAAEPELVDQVLAQLQETGFLNDRQFAEHYAAARLENQGFGKHRVLRDLRQRRVAGDVASTAVNATFEDTDERALIEQYLARKYRGVALAEFLAVDRNLLSAFRRLRLAGFSAGASIRVLKQYSQRADALEESADEPEA
jgi:regulatory protein